MNLSRELFRRYFNSKMNKDELIIEINFCDGKIEEQIRHRIAEAILCEDSEMIEYLIYVLLLCDEQPYNKFNRNSLGYFVNELNKLIISSWHEQHENIAMLLKMIKDDTSVDYLFDAINLHPQYLVWDDNLAFEVKCIWALGDIRTQNAIEKLNVLSTYDNEIIKLNAQKQLVRLSVLS